MDEPNQSPPPQFPPFVMGQPPPWWGMHPMMMGNQGGDSPVFSNTLPARVRLAAEFTFAMARRSGPIVAANEISIMIEPSNPLTTNEKNAWDASCELLTDYFRGNTELDHWEDVRNEAMESENNRRRIGRKLICKCVLDNKGTPTSNCETCRGCGEVLIIPASGC